MARIQAEDWLKAGLELLRDQGIDALRIDQLCARLKKTKGSFYHHFKDMNGYVGALLKRWGDLQTKAAIEVAETAADAKARMALLDETVRHLDHRLDQIIRSWALRDPRAAQALKDVDSTRIAYLKKLLLEAGVREDRAAFMAELEYIAFLGAQQRYPDMNTPKAKALADGMHQVLRAWHQQAIQESAHSRDREEGLN